MTTNTGKDLRLQKQSGYYTPKNHNKPSVRNLRSRRTKTRLGKISRRRNRKTKAIDSGVRVAVVGESSLWLNYKGTNPSLNRKILRIMKQTGRIPTIKLQWTRRRGLLETGVRKSWVQTK